jgi:arsenical pump membrane protein
VATQVIFLSSLSPVPVIIFAATIYLVFKHPMVKIPFTSKYAHIDYGWAPIIGVILLLATFSIGPGTIAGGIFGSDSVRPYSILILIISLSYICVSLDYTGFLEYVSLRVAGASKNSGKRLFVYFFLLTAFLTLFTDNDIVILTMTLIIFYFSKNAKIDPIPFLFAQFFAVNIMGMALYIGNPTNIVAADSYPPHGLSFAEFAKWMFLPSLLAAVTCLFLLWLIFRRRIPSKFETPAVDPRSALRNKNGAIFGSVVLVLTIVFMSVPTSWTGVPIWVIPLFFALVMFLHDIVSYHSSASTIASRVPWKIVPFLIGLFIIIESLASSGWTDLFASQLSRISGSLITTVFGICFLSSIMAGVMNNHPMTIFFVRTLQSSSFTGTTKLGATTALIAGSNFGANFTLIGALAGIMWAKMLSDKGCSISFSEFSKYGLLIMPLVASVACLTLVAELAIFV